jgi:hypothetical protein
MNDRRPSGKPPVGPCALADIANRVGHLEVTQSRRAALRHGEDVVEVNIIAFDWTAAKLTAQTVAIEYVHSEPTRDRPSDGSCRMNYRRLRREDAEA